MAKNTALESRFEIAQAEIAAAIKPKSPAPVPTIDETWKNLTSTQDKVRLILLGAKAIAGGAMRSAFLLWSINQAVHLASPNMLEAAVAVGALITGKRAWDDRHDGIEMAMSRENAPYSNNRLVRIPQFLSNAMRAIDTAPAKLAVRGASRVPELLARNNQRKQFASLHEQVAKQVGDSDRESLVQAIDKWFNSQPWSDNLPKRASVTAAIARARANTTEDKNKPVLEEIELLSIEERSRRLTEMFRWTARQAKLGNKQAQSLVESLFEMSRDSISEMIEYDCDPEAVEDVVKNFEQAQRGRVDETALSLVYLASKSFMGGARSFATFSILDLATHLGQTTSTRPATSLPKSTPTLTPQATPSSMPSTEITSASTATLPVSTPRPSVAATENLPTSAARVTPRISVVEATRVLPSPTAEATVGQLANLQLVKGDHVLNLVRKAFSAQGMEAPVSDPNFWAKMLTANSNSANPGLLKGCYQIAFQEYFRNSEPLHVFRALEFNPDTGNFDSKTVERFIQAAAHGDVSAQWVVARLQKVFDLCPVDPQVIIPKK